MAAFREFPLLRHLLHRGGAFFLLLILAASGCATVPSSPPGRAPSAVVAPGPDPRALAWYAQGLVYEWAGSWEEAGAAYTRAAEYNPAHLESVFRRSVVLLRGQRATEAIALMEKLRTRHPQNPQVLTWMAQLYGATQNQAKAREVLELVVELDPGRAETYAQLAALLAATGREEEAIAVLERGGRQALEPTDLYRMLSELYLRKAAAEAGTEEAKALVLRTIDVLQRTLEKEPEDVATLRRLAELHLQSKDYPAAVGLLERLEALGAGDPRIKERMAAAFLAMGEDQKAIEALEDLARRPGARAPIFQYLGEIHLQAEKLDQARLNFTLATQAPGAEPVTFLRLAMLQVDENPEAAAATLEAGIRQFPQDLRLPETLAYLELSRDRFDLAHGWFEHCEKLMATSGEPPTSTGFLASYAVAALESGRTGKARGLAAEAFRQSPEQIEVFIQYASRKDADRRDEYLATLNALGELHPEDPRLHAMMGHFHHFQEEHEEALARYAQAEKLAKASADPSTVLTERFLFLFGAASERAKQIERAEALFKRVLDMNPKHPEAANYLAYMWAERGLHLDEGLRLVEIALEHAPDSAAYIDTKGWIFFMKGDFEQAYPLLRKAYDLMGDDPVVSEHYGDVLDKLGRTTEAVEIWKKSFALDPDRPELVDKLTAAGVDVEALRPDPVPDPDAPIPEPPPLPDPGTQTHEPDAPPIVDDEK